MTGQISPAGEELNKQSADVDESTEQYCCAIGRYGQIEKTKNLLLAGNKLKMNLARKSNFS